MLISLDDFKKVIADNIQLAPIIDEAMKRNPPLKDDAFHHGIIAQLLDLGTTHYYHSHSFSFCTKNGSAERICEEVSSTFAE